MKKGQGKNSLQMISTILMIVTLVMGISGQCKEKKKEQPTTSQFTRTPGITTEIMTCEELRGYKCNPFTQICHGDKLPAGDNTKEGICYSEGAGDQKEGGWRDKTCAFQKGFNCRTGGYCPKNQWILAKDTSTCCSTACVVRVQAKTSIPDVGQIVVERFDKNAFGIWYGGQQTQPFAGNTGFKTVGYPNYSPAYPIGKNKYEFSIEGNKHRFILIKNEATEIAAVGER